MPSGILYCIHFDRRHTTTVLESGPIRKKYCFRFYGLSLTIKKCIFAESSEVENIQPVRI
jgi:hypothetical protein